MIAEASSSVCFLSVAHSPWGAEHSLAALVTAMDAQGVQTHVVCASELVAAFLRSRGLTSIEVIDAGRGRLQGVARFARWIRRSPLAYDAYVLFSLDLAPLVAVVPRRVRERTTLDLHDAPTKRRTRLVLNGCALLCRRVLCISDYVARIVTRGSVVVVPRPIDAQPEFVRPEPTEQQHLAPPQVRVGVVGRVDPEKNIELAVDAVRRLPSNFRLVVVGDAYSSPAYAASLEDTAARVLSDRFERTPSTASSKLYRALDVLLVANAGEPSGRTVGEAMAARIPVVVPDRGGAPEYVRAGTSGLVYRAGDPEDAARQLLALNDPSRYEAVATAGREQVSRERSVPVVATRYLEALGIERRISADPARRMTT